MTIAFSQIVVIDDDSERASTLATILRTARGGFSVETSADPAAAVSGLHGAPYDLALVQAALAAADDFALLRSMPRGDLLQPPIIVYGDGGQGALLRGCLEHGAADYLTPPLEPGLVKARVLGVIQRQQLEEQFLAPLLGYEDMKLLADDLRDNVLPLGITLAAHADRPGLLKQILNEAVRLSGADAGILLLVDLAGTLQPVAARIDSLDLSVDAAGSHRLGLLPAVEAAPGTVAPDVAVFAARAGRSVNLADFGRQQHYRSAALEQLEQRLGYHAGPCLTLPIWNHRAEAVLLLANARSADGERIVPFSHYVQLVMESLAAQSAVVLHNHSLRLQQESWQRYEQELELGREIQAGFFPRTIPQPDGWAVAAHFQSAREVAGDFYDVFELPDKRLGLLVADVCDKGVVAALYMALVRSLLRAFAMQHYYLTERQPQLLPNASRPVAQDMAAMLDTIRLTNRYIDMHHRDTHMFATVFFGVLDTRSGRLLYVNAGHNPPVVYNQAGVLHRLGPTGPAIGLVRDPRFGLKDLALRPGDTFLAFTDGVTEALNADRRQFGESRLLAQLRGPNGGAAATLDRLRAALIEHASGAEPNDDVTLVAVERLSRRS